MRRHGFGRRPAPATGRFGSEHVVEGEDSLPTVVMERRLRWPVEARHRPAFENKSAATETTDTAARKAKLGRARVPDVGAVATPAAGPSADNAPAAARSLGPNTSVLPALADAAAASTLSAAGVVDASDAVDPPSARDCPRSPSGAGDFKSSVMRRDSLRQIKHLRKG